MHRLRVYRIRPSKQIFSRTPGSRSLRCAVTEGGGDGEGEGRYHSICFKDADKSVLRLSADVIGRTNPEGVRQSSADSELRRGYDKKIKKRGGHESVSTLNVLL